MKQFLGVVLGVLFGFLGAYLYQKSAAPPVGSIQEELEKVNHENLKLKVEVNDFRAKAENRRPRDSSSLRASELAQSIREGKDVDLDDVFNVTKPMMRDLSPLFDRMRKLEEKREFDRIAGEMSRKYGLTDAQQKDLKKWLRTQSEKNAEGFQAVLESESSGFVDMVLATNDAEHTKGIDNFMERTLKGEKLEEYREQRTTDRIESVHAEADRNTQRIDNIVGLDDEQEDQVFMLMARSSDDFDPVMEFEGMSSESRSIASSSVRTAAILSVLRPEQRKNYEEHRRKKKAEAEANFREIGLGLPANWDLLEQDDF